MTLKNALHNGKNETYIAADPPLALVFFIHSTKMETNADLAAEEIQSNPPSEVSVSRQSPAESMVQALVALVVDSVRNQTGSSSTRDRAIAN